MKKALTAVVVAALAIIALVVIAFSIHMPSEETSITEETVSSDSVMRNPPQLTVLGADDSAQARLGTYSWDWEDEDGGKGTSSDSVHPLAAQEYTPVLSVDTDDSAQNVTLAFEADVEPDSVSVRAWDTAYWGADDSAPSVEVPVTQDDEGCIGFALLSYDAVYEVHAVWDSADDYSGDAYYSFATSIE
ncbi:MAG: hypothetical protein UDB11_10125 [Peptococcaceae bacterium]|nr:hypothetical protein [Peptococcaceae bacterium]